MAKNTNEWLEIISDNLVGLIVVLVCGFGICILFLYGINGNIKLINTPIETKTEFPIDGCVEAIGKYSLIVDGKTYDFCSDDIDHVNIGNRVRIERESEGWGCGNVLVYSQDKSICNKDRKYMEVKK